MRGEAPARSRGLVLAAVLVLVAYGALLRFHRLGEQSFWIDEAITVTHARAILAHGYPLLPNGRVSWSSAPAHYLAAAGLRLAGEPHAGARLLPAAAGAASVALLFWLALLVFRRRSTALLSAALLAVATIAVAWSRQARAYAFVQLFDLAGLALLFRFFDAPRARTFWAGTGLLALAVLCHPAGAWALVAGVVAFCLPPRAFSGRFAAAVPQPRLRPVVALFAGAVLLVALGLSYRGEALRLLFSLSPGAASYGVMYAGFFVDQLGLLSVLSVAGALVALVALPARAAGLLAGAAVYAAFISLRTPIFGFRYALPLVPVVIAFASYAVTLPLPARASSGRRAAAGGAAALVLLAGGLWWARLSWVPAGEYRLGYTEPQPNWRAAYAWIAEDIARRARKRPSAAPPALVSALPFLDAEYLRAIPHRRHYLPVSHTGLPGSLRRQPPYVAAETIGALGQLRRLGACYVVLDDFGLRMLGDARTREHLAATPPAVIIPGAFPVAVWRLGG